MNCQKCGSFSYFKMPTGICRKCTARLERVQHLKANYKPKKGYLNWDVIQFIWRKKLTVTETAIVMGISEARVRQEIETARQNAR